MKVTAIRIRRLVSGPGFNNHAVEIEAAVEDGDDPDAVAVDVRRRVDAELHQQGVLSSLQGSVAETYERIDIAEGRLRRLNADIAAQEKIFDANVELADLAIKRGIDVPPELPGLIPF